MTFPTPNEIGLPAKFQAWRPNQPKVIQDVLECDKRAIVQVQRAGAGKTASYMGALKMMPGTRAAILTVNKQLQTQLMEDFEEIGLADIKGKNAYECQGRPGHSCETGSLSKCPFVGTGICLHSAAKTLVSESDIMSTNYTCWMAANHYGNGFGQFDVLVLDEAHEAAAQVARAMQVKLSEEDLDIVKAEWPDHRSRDDMEAWKHWALVTKHAVAEKLSGLEASLAAKPKRSEVEYLKRVGNLNRKLADIYTAQADNWVVETWNHGYQFDPIEASQYAERLLLRKIPKLMLTSGTIHPRGVEGLGLATADYEFREYYSKINPARTPLYWLPTLKVTRSVQEWEIKQQIVAQIDRILGARQNVKGVIHTGNFRIRDIIMKHSKYADQMITNYGDGPTTGMLVEQFKRMDAPMWFVSPSLGTGVDLPYDACRLQICAKLPFADAGSKVEREREAKDETRGIFNMLQRLAQQFGRGDRADDDWQEFFILDNNISWVWWRHADLLPLSLIPYWRPLGDQRDDGLKITLPNAPRMAA